MFTILLLLLQVVSPGDSSSSSDGGQAFAVLHEAHFFDCDVEQTDLVASGTVVEVLYDRDTLPGHFKVADLLYLTVALDSVYFSPTECPPSVQMNHRTHLVFDDDGALVGLGGVAPDLWIRTSDRILFRAASRPPESRGFNKAPFDICDALFFVDNTDTLYWNSGSSGLRGVDHLPTDQVALHNLVRRSFSPVKYTLEEIESAIVAAFK